MFKRSGIWQSTKMIKGTRRKWSTKTSDKATAERRARDHWQKVIAEEHGMVDRQASRSTAPTLGQVIEAYLAQEVASPSAQTRRQNVNMLKRVVAIGAGRYNDDMSLTVLDADLVERFQAARIREIKGLEARERAKFSANSMLTQARSVFRSTKLYEKMGYKLPDLASFRSAERFTDVAIDSEFRPFSDRELVAISGGLAQLRADKSTLYVVAALMLYGGLRNSEVWRGERTWLQERAGDCWIVVRVSKTARGVRWVPLPREVFAAVKELAGDHWLVNATTVTERRHIAERAINDWLKQLAPDRLAYDLRRQAGSSVLDAQGIEAARDFLGHRTADTTRKWYASRISLLKPIMTLAPAQQPR